MKYKVLIPQEVSVKAINYLEANDCECICLHDCSVENMCKYVGDCDAILARTADFNQVVLEKGIKLKIVARHGAGLDNIDLDYAREKGIVITNTPGANSNSVAEHTIALMLACAKNIPYFDKITREGDWVKRDTEKTIDVSGKTLGLIGFGRISGLVAKKAALGFDMNVLVYRTHRDTPLPEYIQEAENMVAWPNEMDATTTVERINKAFVKGLLARVCLQASGYSLRSDGNSSLSSDPELAKSVLYPIALQACKDVMAEEGKYVALKTNFEDIFIDNCRDIIKAGSESLWEIPYNNEPTARGRQVYTFGLRHETADVIVNYKQSGGQAGPTPFFFFDYSQKDKRRDVTCVPYKWNKGVQELNSIDKWYFGKLRYEWMNRYIESTDDGINKQYMRYADIVLMRAELENELNGPASAAPYLKQIRQRAFDQADWNTEVDQYVAAVQGNKDAMFDAIVQERALEFCGEFVRKADLIRWNLLKTKLDEAKAKMYRLRDLQGEYAELSGHLYYKMEDYTWTRNGASNTIEDGSLVTYGLNRDEQNINPAGYTEYTNSSGETKTWISSSQLKDEKIEAIYAQDPVKYMYWPIFQVNLNANPELKNYSWYN